MLRCIVPVVIASIFTTIINLEGYEAKADVSALRDFIHESRDQMVRDQQSRIFDYQQLTYSQDPAQRSLGYLLLAEDFVQSRPLLALQYLGLYKTHPDDLYKSRQDLLELKLANHFQKKSKAFRYMAHIEKSLKDMNQRSDLYKSSLEEMIIASSWLGKEKFFDKAWQLYLERFPYHKRDEKVMIIAAEYLGSQPQNKQYIKVLESMASFHPSTDGAEWAYEKLVELNQTTVSGEKKAYYFDLNLLRKINRYSYLKPGLNEQIIELLSGQVRDLSGKVTYLSKIEKIYALQKIRERQRSVSLAEDLVQDDNLSKPFRNHMHRFLARQYLRLEDYNKSEQHSQLSFDEKRASVPVPTARILASTHLYQGEYHEAKNLYSKMMTKTPRDRWYHFWTAYLSGDYSQAWKLYKSRRYVHYADFKSQKLSRVYWKAMLLKNTGKTKAAVRLAGKIVEKWPKSFYAYLIKNGLSELSDGKAFQDTASAAILTAYNTEAAKDELRSKSRAKRFYPIAYAQSIERVSEVVDIDKFLVLSIMKAESHYRPEALSMVGARGLMQMMPATAKKMASIIGDNQFAVEELHIPQVSIAYGSLYLKMLLQYYDNNMFAAIAAYNAGPAAVNRWLNKCGGCRVDEFVEMIPIKETRRYVKKVFGFYNQYVDIYGPAGDKVEIAEELPLEVDREAYIF